MMQVKIDASINAKYELIYSFYVIYNTFIVPFAVNGDMYALLLTSLHSIIRLFIYNYIIYILSNKDS